jgi:chromate transport protein ChrA
LEIPLHELFDWNRLDAAAFRVSVRRSVRRLAWVGAVVGVVAAGCGLAAPFVPLVVIGLSLLGAGVWNLCRPSITGLIVDGVAMILAGAFNCLAWQWIEDARGSSVVKWIIAGLVQIVWGIRRLASYRTARLAVHDPQAIARLESIVRDLSRRNAKADPTVAEFRTGRIRRQRNRLGLYADGAIALLEHQAVRLERRTDVWIEARGTTWLGRSIKVRIQMGELQLTGEMPAAHFERFERWKLGQSEPRPVAA